MVLCNICIFNAEPFFISNKEIRKFFGFAPAKIFKGLAKRNKDDESSEEYEELYRREYAQSINEKLKKLAKERQVELLDLEHSNKHENVEGFSKTGSKLNANQKPYQEEDAKIVKIKIINDDDKRTHDDSDYSKVLLMVPTGGYKNHRHPYYDNDDEYYKHFQGYPESYQEEFSNDPPLFHHQFK